MLGLSRFALQRKLDKYGLGTKRRSKAEANGGDPAPSAPNPGDPGAVSD